ncbi:MAG: DUF115 domain-containing protein [Candidatus Gastranaerophilales bacterium]|nr:DUF115 domain-containing protein [Candidatus Gastranaerophilales bacterium]
MTIFEKNLENIKKYNTDLAQRLLNHNQIDKPFEFTQTKSGDANLLYNGILLHDNIDPLDEAVSILNKTQHTQKNDITVIFGLGLGYLFKRFIQSSKTKILIFEPNIDILRITLDVVDFSEDFAKKTVRLVDKIDDIQKYFGDLFFIDAEVNFIFLNSYTKFYPEMIPQLADKLAFDKGLYKSNYTNLMRKSYAWTSSGISNIAYTAEHYSLETLRGKFKNKPAIIVSAGPSLDKNIAILKKLEGKALIITVGAALKSLVKNDIKPDFGVFIEHYCSKGQIKGLNLSDLNIILQSSTHIDIHNENAKRFFNYYPNNDFVNQWLASILNIDLQDYLNKGTVSLTAVFSARIMGCNPIILVGQDLAYTDGKSYASDASHSNVVCKKNPETGKYEVGPADIDKYIKDIDFDHKRAKEFVEKRFAKINRGLFFVKGQNGELLPTEPGYATFINYFENMAKEFGSEIDFINCSTGGAYIEGFKHKNLDEVLSSINSEKIDAEKVIESTLQNNLTDIASKRILLDKLNEQINLFEKSLPLFKQGIDFTTKAKNEFIKNKIHTPTSKKYFKETIKTYLIIENSFIKQSKIFFGIILGEHFPLSNYLDLNTKNADYDSSMEFLFLSKTFFEKGRKKIADVLVMMKNAGEILNENCNSKG